MNLNEPVSLVTPPAEMLEEASKAWVMEEIEKASVSIQEGKTPDDVALRHLWNLTVRMMWMAYHKHMQFDQEFGEPAQELDEIETREFWRTQGVKDTCRKTLLMMRDLPEFSDKYVTILSGIYDYTVPGENEMWDEHEKRVEELRNG